ncbi:MAG: hypothetical protein R3B91_20565 [Planctomycetaceae bacterium]
MAYVGLVPSEHSSGSDAAWFHYQDGEQHGKAPHSGGSYVVLLPAGRDEPGPQGRETSWSLRKMGRIAWTAQKRLHRKFQRLVYEKGKPSPVAVIAVARELAGFLWAIASRSDRWPVERAQAAAARPEPRSPMSQPFSSRTNEHDRLMTTHNETSSGSP